MLLDTINAIFVYVLSIQLFTSSFSALIELLLYVTYGCLIIFTCAKLIQKRLKDVNFETKDINLIIFFTLVCTGLGFFSAIFFAIPIILGIILGLTPTNMKRNKFGYPSKVYSELRKRKESLTAWAKHSLYNNDFKEAIKFYTQLEDSGAVQKTKKKHLTHTFSLLDSKINKMKKKNVLYRNMGNNRDEIRKLLVEELWVNENDISNEIAEKKPFDTVDWNENENNVNVETDEVSVHLWNCKGCNEQFYLESDVLEHEEKCQQITELKQEKPLEMRVEIEPETVFVPGVTIVHEEYGKGEIIESEPKDENYKLIINFEDGSEKTLLSTFIKLVDVKENDAEEGDEEE
ncbi:MAG TPA: hypothetical protein QF851_04595 [Flavobacteriales bacterium]|nr:hypothetical protein [Flavobacteriales bacterium]